MNFEEKSLELLDRAEHCISEVDDQEFSRCIGLAQVYANIHAAQLREMQNELQLEVMKEIRDLLLEEKVERHAS